MEEVRKNQSNPVSQSRQDVSVTPIEPKDKSAPPLTGESENKSKRSPTDEAHVYSGNPLFLSTDDKQDDGEGSPALDYDFDLERLYALWGLLVRSGNLANLEAVAADALNQGVDIEELVGTGKTALDIKKMGKAVLELLRKHHIHDRTRSSTHNSGPRP